jgi:hypothetical protein
VSTVSGIRVTAHHPVRVTAMVRPDGSAERATRWWPTPPASSAPALIRVGLLERGQGRVQSAERAEPTLSRAAVSDATFFPPAGADTGHAGKEA